MIRRITRLGAHAALPATAFALSMAIAAPALAQQAALEEVTVTARKTSESLQEVPLTVTAIGGQSIERFNYDKIADVVSRIPTLNVQVGGSGSGAQITLRGVGSSNISAAFDSAVAFDFDGFQVSTMRILQSSFFDVQQIEVLKGPQSLFFGKSASAGVMSIKSANPTDEWEFSGKGSYEFEERGYTVEAIASGPITDELGFRIAARFNDISRQYINAAPDAERKKGQENVNIRATFQWDPAETLDFNLKLNYVGHENDGAISNAVLDCGANGVADVITLFGGAFNIPAGYDCDTSGDYYFRVNGAAPLVAQVEDYDANGGRPYGESDIFFGVLTWNWDITDEITLTHVTGYLDQDAQDADYYSYGGILGGASFGQGGGLTDHQTEQFTQELRLATGFDAPVNLMLGVFYEDRHIEFNTNQYAVNIGNLAPDPVTGNTSDWYKRHLYDNKAFSVFGQITWDITDRLELAGGVRWSDEKKVNTILVPYVHAFLIGPAFVASGFDSGDIIFKDDNMSPEASLTYRVTDDINVYAAYKTGFKSGGIDNSALPSANLLGLGSADPAVVQATEDGIIYQSETAKGGEVGMKGQFLDRTLTLNISSFYYVFKDLQVQNFDAVAIQFQTGNASEVTTKGVDMDFNWATPVDGFSVFGSLAFTSAKFTAPFDPNPNNADTTETIQGRRTARAPKWAGNIAADYRASVGNALELGLTGNMKFSSSYFTNEDSFTDHVQKAYAIFDLAVSLGDPGTGWQVALIGRNIGDKRFVTTSGPRPFLIGGVGDDNVWNLNRGRHVFLEASFKY